MLAGGRVSLTCPSRPFFSRPRRTPSDAGARPDRRARPHPARGLAEQADKFVGMELTDPAIDFVGLARSLGIEGQRAATVKDATDLIGKALKDGTPMLIDVDMERGYKPM